MGQVEKDGRKLRKTEKKLVSQNICVAFLKTMSHFQNAITQSKIDKITKCLTILETSLYQLSNGV